MTISRLKALLKHKRIPALLVSNLTNLQYVTGLHMSAGLLLVTKSSAVLFVDGRYTEYAKKHAKGIKIIDFLKIENELKKIKTCAFEADEVTVAKLNRWKKRFKNTKFIQSSDLVEGLRREKSPQEISYFKKAQRLTRALFPKIEKVLKPGITEKALAFQITSWAEEMGADGLSFDPIVAFAKHTSSPHHHPTSQKLKRGDIVQIDIGVRVKGYCADQSRIFFTGAPTQLQLAVLDAVTEAKEACTKAIKVGVSNRKVDELARSVLKKYGFDEYFIHSLGHGVGLDIHEGVNLSMRAPETKLLKNEIVTIEPGVYIPGKFGIRLEDEVIVS